MQYSKIFVLLLSFSTIHFSNLSAQNFSLEIDSDTAFLSAQNETKHTYAYLKNETADTLIVNIIRDNYQGLPLWANGMCVDDICYYVSTDSVQAKLGPFEEIQFSSGFILLDETTTEISEANFRFIDILTNDDLNYDSYAVNTITTTSIFNQPIQKQINIFPNPVQNTLHIDAKLEVLELQLFNNLGQPVPIKAFQFGQIDMEYLNGGFYLLRIKTPEGISEFPIVKN